MKNTALITGSTSGIGEALAHECAKNGHNIVVTSRDSAHVARLSAELERAHNVTAIGLPFDLTEPSAPAKLKAELDSRGVEVEILINNAGRGAKGNFHEIDLEDHITVIRLNIEALTRLTRLYLPEFVARGHGRLMNVGSIASFQPGPLMAAYHASKAYVLSLTEAIAEELKDSPVTVTCLCPGPTDTEFFERAALDDSRVAESGQLMDPVKVAEGGFKAMKKGDRIFIPGGMNKTMTFMRRLMPESAQAKFNELLYADSKKS